MKLKRLLLILLVGLSFIACFYYLNQKYDRFYRIVGIDNEKRQLILNHLSEKEQDYLVEKSIATDRFMKYIQIEDFSLLLINYYEVMEDSDLTFLNDEHLVKYTNEIITKIKSLTNKNVASHFKQIIKYKLDSLFLQSETYDLSLTSLYAIYKTSYENMNLAKIDEINALNVVLEEHLYLDNEKRNFLKKWHKTYSIYDLTTFLTRKLKTPYLELVEYPDSLTVLINDEQTISSYVPEPLTIPSDVSRVSFAMYLRQDACVALEEMYNACLEDIDDETFLLVRAYQSYDVLETNYLTTMQGKRGGKSEFQLGTSIDVAVLNHDYATFNTTKICQYLKENSWKYGFIQRYSNPEQPEYNDHIYRYVGEQAAKLIYEQQKSLEEYEGV